MYMHKLNNNIGLKNATLGDSSGIRFKNISSYKIPLNLDGNKNKQSTMQSVIIIVSVK